MSPKGHAAHAARKAPRDTVVRDKRSEVIGTLILAIGLWLFVAPWVLGYPFTAPAVDAHLNEIVVGIIVFACGLARLIRPRGLLSDLTVLLAGIWMVVAPFVFGYGDTARAELARVNSVAVGIVLIILAALSLLLAAFGRRGAAAARQ
ncbi:SPW repeat protein [Streptomyces gobiensis]|uniref:SPW repeat protein n=1 Tax=Streptomyces gobiensis TaxID=2875706 RepID=UPI001E610E69|nr:SPW repeat protein [Streptomyces gobiensis]UGY94620.1 SPW repeat protein [Streptomyces gobiensis]